MGENLAQDLVIKVEGKISGTDKSGVKIPDPKVIADSITIITDAELDAYQATGKKMRLPRRKLPEAPATTTTPAPDKYFPPREPRRQLYIHVKDPTDDAKLVLVRKKLSEYAGDDEIILVLGADNKDALRLPFRTNICPDLTAALADIYGKDCVVVK
jgi:hypothetical protein